MIALLVPSYRRPEQFIRMLQSVEATASNVRVYAAIDGPDLYDYRAEAEKMFPDIVWMGVHDVEPTGYKWNRLASEALRNSCNKLFMLGADDTLFTTPLWDKALIDDYARLPNKIHVYSLKDSRDENGTPHPIVSREYINAMGYFVPPIFLHWYVDTSRS